MTKNINQDVDMLNYFGEKLIKTSRDNTFSQELKVLDGSANAPESKKLYEKIINFSPEQVEVIKEIIIDSIDGALNNFLWFLEQEEKIDLVFYQDSKSISLKDASDGLSVDYWNFVDAFSDFSKVKTEPCGELSPDEYILQTFPESPEEAKRYLVRILNNKRKFDAFKTLANNIPFTIMESLIEMILSNSSLHNAECNELKEIIHQSTTPKL